jgi:hypothetical protein
MCLRCEVWFKILMRCGWQAMTRVDTFVKWWLCSWKRIAKGYVPCVRLLRGASCLEYVRGEPKVSHERVVTVTLVSWARTCGGC